MQERWRRETDGITLSSLGDSWNPFKACLSPFPPLSLSLSYPAITLFSIFPYLLSSLSVTLPDGPASAVDTAISK